MKEEKFKGFLLKYLKGQKKLVAKVAVFFIVNIMLQVIAPRILSYFIDSAKSGKTLQFIRLVVLIYLTTIILNMVVGVYETYIVKKFGLKITNSFRKDVLSHFLNIDMKHHEKWTSGEVITRLDGDVEGLFTYFHTMIFKIAGSIFLMIGVLLVLAGKNLLITFAMLVFCIITVAVFKVIQDLGAKTYVRRAEATAKFNGIMKEKIDNVIEIRTNGAERYSMYSFNKALKRLFKESFPAGMMYSKLWTASTVLDALSKVIFLGVAVMLWNKELISLGTVYLIHTYSKLIYGPLQNFREHLKTLQEAKAGILRVKDMLSVDSEIKEGKRELVGNNIKLSVRGLSFGYRKDNNVIHDINLDVNPGERLGIMGETGSGKSTIAKLLGRLYEFERGEILMNGISVKELNEENLRSKIAYCTQEVQFVHGTLRNNITLYNEEISDKDIHSGIKKMGLEKWFKKFPKGLDTELEMAENNLSAGESQLISILRLFLKNPAIVILDEISSRLDSVTEQRVMDAIDVLTKDRTVISIAHKISALRWIDNVMIMKDGRVIESGSRDELEKDEKSKFYSICMEMRAHKEVEENEILRV